MVGTQEQRSKLKEFVKKAKETGAVGEMVEEMDKLLKLVAAEVMAQVLQT